MSSLPLNTTPPLRSAPSKISIIPPISPTHGPFGASKDARQIVRLAQCPQCSKLLDEPVTLPCGNSICKKCIPERHLRLNISYPATANRLQGFTCPFSTCRKEHAEGDCSVNVVLNNIMSILRMEIECFLQTPEASGVVLQVEAEDKWAMAGIPSLHSEPFVRLLHGGRLASIYMAVMGGLPRDSEVSFTLVSNTAEEVGMVDELLLERLKDTTRTELDCQVCYNLFLDPFTTTCGHTFCRKCLHRALDHSSLCPICRRTQSLPPSFTPAQAPSNTLLSKLLAGLYSDALQARAEAAIRDDLGGRGELDTSLFICTLSLPTMPTFLHIFEPRYRLMIRRAVESGDRKFGMLLRNSSQVPQGQLGSVPFYEYGTLLRIVNMHLLPDGRSMLETVGTTRFRVLRHGSLDGYMIGKIERVDDMTLAEEEALEASETASTSNNPISPLEHLSSSRQPLTPDELSLLPTRTLMEFCVTFVKMMRQKSTPWLHNSVYQAYGECPEDPATFPWWFASVLPISEVEKHKLLETSSVRQRLKICARWISELEAQRRYASLLQRSGSEERTTAES